jgi:thioredoxin 1
MYDVFTLTDETYDSFISRSSVPVLVDFWAEWCAPCRLLAPLVENLSNEYGEKLAVCKIDIDSSPKVAARFGITALPTLILFKDGSPVGRHVGVATPAKLRSFLSEHL